MSILNKSVYRKYQHLLDNDYKNGITDDRTITYKQYCPICNNGTMWSECQKHYANSLIRYIEASMWYIQLLEMRTMQAEDRAMVCSKQNYELRQALTNSQKTRKYYNEVAVELAKTLHNKRYELTIDE